MELEEFETLVLEYIRPVWPQVALDWPEQQIEVGQDLLWPAPERLTVFEYVSGFQVLTRAGILVADMGYIIRPSAIRTAVLRDRFSKDGMAAAMDWLRQAIAKRDAASREIMARHPVLTKRVLSIANAAALAGIVPTEAARISPGSAASAASLVRFADIKRMVCRRCHEIHGKPDWMEVDPRPDWCPARTLRTEWGRIIVTCRTVYFSSKHFSSSTPEETWRQHIGVGSPKTAAAVVQRLLREVEKWEMIWLSLARHP